jgi:hypothetical protein
VAVGIRPRTKHHHRNDPPTPQPPHLWIALSPSRTERFERDPLLSAMKPATHAASVYECCRSAHPMALRMKN